MDFLCAFPVDALLDTSLLGEGLGRLKRSLRDGRLPTDGNAFPCFSAIETTHYLQLSSAGLMPASSLSNEAAIDELVPVVGLEPTRLFKAPGF